MSPTAVALLTLSAALHAAWNFYSQRRAASAAFFAVAVLATLLCFSPFLLRYAADLWDAPDLFWPLVAATGLFEAVYLVGLAQAYRVGNLSLAYPLVRALPVVLVALVSVLLGRGEALSAPALLGMAAVTAGCLLLPLERFSALTLGVYESRAVAWALLAALGVTGYTLVDDAALKLLGYLPVGTRVLAYLPLQALSTLLWLGLYLALRGPWRLDPRALPSAALTGLTMAVTYGVTLAAFNFVRDVSYANAFRQLSVLMGALLGLLVAKEPAYRPKLIGLGVMLLGLVLTALG